MRYLFSFFIFFTFSFSLYGKEQVQIVGSSTVYPFVTIIAENFKNKNREFKAPIVESTGTGGGFRMFCSSSSLNSPDIVNASRKIKSSEIELCSKNGVNDILEVIIGYDAIVMAHSNQLETVSLTKEQIFLALARKVPDSQGNLIDNPYKKWSDINQSLPNVPIKVMGPPSTSGTRDSFLELVFEPACKEMIKKKSLKMEKNSEKEFCNGIRADGPWINGGENDSLLIQKVTGSADTFAILGYSYYAQNQRTINAAVIDGAVPSYENLSNNLYSVSRPLFIYVKAQNINYIPSLNAFVKEIVSPSALGPKGYLVKAGLISISPEEYKNTRNKVLQYTN